MSETADFQSTIFFPSEIDKGCPAYFGNPKDFTCALHAIPLQQLRRMRSQREQNVFGDPHEHS